MPQAIPTIAAWAAKSFLHKVIVSVIVSTLINTALGALQFTDDEGEIWIAVDE